MMATETPAYGVPSERLVMPSDLVYSIRREARSAARQAEYGNVNEEAYERMLMMRLSRLRRAIDQCESEIREIFHHAHKWDADDFCSVCGTDGRS